MTAPTKHTRRAVLAGIAAGGAVATAATTAIAAVPTSDPLIAIEAVPGPNDRRLLELERDLVPYQAWVNDLPRPDLSVAEEARHGDQLYEMLNAIADTPADSVIGLMVKVRQFRDALGNESLEDALPDHHNWHLQAVVRDLERLATEARHA